MERFVLDAAFVFCGFILGAMITNNAWRKRMVAISKECQKIQDIVNEIIEKAKREEER